MQVLRRVIGAFSEDSEARRRKPACDRCRSRITLEILEQRDLLSIAGVTLQYGNLAITGTKSSGNVSQMWIDPSNQNVAVSLNGQSEEFAATTVTSVTYKSGANGGDTFANNTGLANQDYGYGGNNNFTGSTGYNFIYLFGNNNTYTVKGGINVAWTARGLGDVFNNTVGASLAVYTT
jgi:hypothetical protein